MKSRCYDPSRKGYKHYGGRGIVVCDEWLHDPVRFVVDMGPKPTPKHSLDRIDNNGPYSPDNCRWADKPTQSRNRRDNRFVVTPDGRSMCIKDCAAAYGVSYMNLLYRLNTGMSLEDALQKKPVYNKTQIAKLAREHGINKGTLTARVGKLGWSLEKALSEPHRGRGYNGSNRELQVRP